MSIISISSLAILLAAFCIASCQAFVSPSSLVFAAPTSTTVRQEALRNPFEERLYDLDGSEESRKERNARIEANLNRRKLAKEKKEGLKPEIKEEAVVKPTRESRKKKQPAEDEDPADRLRRIIEMQEEEGEAKKNKRKPKEQPKKTERAKQVLSSSPAKTTSNNPVSGPGLEIAQAGAAGALGLAFLRNSLMQGKRSREKNEVKMSKPVKQAPSPPKITPPPPTPQKIPKNSSPPPARKALTSTLTARRRTPRNTDVSLRKGRPSKFNMVLPSLNRFNILDIPKEQLVGALGAVIALAVLGSLSGGGSTNKLDPAAAPVALDKPEIVVIVPTPTPAPTPPPEAPKVMEETTEAPAPLSVVPKPDVAVEQAAKDDRAQEERNDAAAEDLAKVREDELRVKNAEAALKLKARKAELLERQMSKQKEVAAANSRLDSSRDEKPDGTGVVAVFLFAVGSVVATLLSPLAVSQEEKLAKQKKSGKLSNEDEDLEVD